MINILKDIKYRIYYAFFYHYSLIIDLILCTKSVENSLFKQYECNEVNNEPGEYVNYIKAVKYIRILITNHV